MHQIFGYWKSNVIQRNCWSLLSQRVKTSWDRHGSQFVRIFIYRAEVQQLYKTIYIYIMVPVALMLFSITTSHLLKSTLIFFSVWPKSKNCLFTLQIPHSNSEFKNLQWLRLVVIKDQCMPDFAMQVIWVMRLEL